MDHYGIHFRLIWVFGWFTLRSYLTVFCCYTIISRSSLICEVAYHDLILSFGVSVNLRMDFSSLLNSFEPNFNVYFFLSFSSYFLLVTRLGVMHEKECSKLKVVQTKTWQTMTAISNNVWIPFLSQDDRRKELEWFIFSYNYGKRYSFITKDCLVSRVHWYSLS